MPFSDIPQEHLLQSLSDVQEESYWMDDADDPGERSRLIGAEHADYCIVGGGFTGLWAAIDAKRTQPDLDVVLVEGHWVGYGATGRNGGFVAASLTHGFFNGLSRWPEEMTTLTKMGLENLEAIEQFIQQENIDCDWMRVGELDVATESYQVEGLRSIVDEAAPFGEELQWFDQEQVRTRVNSPTYLGGVYDADGVALVDPARLAWGMREVALREGVRIFEQSVVRDLVETTDGMEVITELGRVTCRKVLLATNAFPPLLRRLKNYIVPVYDSVLVTQPLTDQQRRDIGWTGNEGVSDSGNQFHYYRPTVDGRILWGGYDATYHWRNGFGADYERTVNSWAKIASHFFTTFPQLEGVKFSHAWSGAIDTCTRFCAFWGQAYGNKVAYVAGYTGLGVGASRFGALVANDLLFDRASDRRELTMVKSRPMPFPPEPLRSAAVQVTRWSLKQADNNEGQRNLWLRSLDRFGIGFDS